MAPKTMELDVADGVLSVGYDGGQKTRLTTALAVIKDQLKRLKSWRKKRTLGPDPNLDEDIRVYEHIVALPNGEELALAYLKTMHDLRSKRGGASVRKMEAAKALGWEVK